MWINPQIWFDRGLVTLREVVQHYLEMNSYLQEALQQKDRDQLLETTVNICFSIETQGAWLAVKSIGLKSG